MEEKRYIFLEHTADAKFVAFGKTLEHAFINAALAVSSLMWDWNKIEPRIEYPIEVSGRDIEQMLVGFLEEVLFLLDTQGFLLGGVDKISISQEDQDYRLKAVFKGDSVQEKYSMFGDVKAITYNEMKIVQNHEFRVQVVVDI